LSVTEQWSQNVAKKNDIIYVNNLKQNAIGYVPNKAPVFEGKHIAMIFNLDYKKFGDLIDTFTVGYFGRLRKSEYTVLYIKNIVILLGK